MSAKADCTLTKYPDYFALKTHSRRLTPDGPPLPLPSPSAPPRPHLLWPKPLITPPHLLSFYPEIVKFYFHHHPCSDNRQRSGQTSSNFSLRFHLCRRQPKTQPKPQMRKLFIRLRDWQRSRKTVTTGAQVSLMCVSWKEGGWGALAPRDALTRC